MAEKETGTSSGRSSTRNLKAESIRGRAASKDNIILPASSAVRNSAILISRLFEHATCHMS